jgi:hypothetical protein
LVSPIQVTELEPLVALRFSTIVFTRNSVREESLWIIYILTVAGDLSVNFISVFLIKESNALGVNRRPVISVGSWRALGELQEINNCPKGIPAVKDLKITTIKIIENRTLSFIDDFKRLNIEKILDIQPNIRI